MEDNTPIDEIIFDMEMTLCESIPSITPFALRKERAIDVYGFIVRYSKYAKKKNKEKNKPKIIRKPAKDTWF